MSAEPSSAESTAGARRNGGHSPPSQPVRQGKGAQATSRVHVCARLAPARDTAGGAQLLQYQVRDGGRELALNCTVASAVKDDREVRHYEFSHVFDRHSTEEAVFEHLWREGEPKLQAGYNSTVLCYGQTGSGKTHTINNLLPRMVNGCWSMARGASCRFEVCFVQIYLDKVYDLLGGSRSAQRGEVLQCKGLGAEGMPRPYVAVSSPEEVLALFRKGSQWRAAGSHALNDRSSRSHTLFFLRMTRTVGDRRAQVSVLTMVDLAGSERVARTQTTGEGFEEGVAINRALTALGRVIHALGTGSEVVGFRDNLLTMYLCESLTNSYFALVCCCSSDGRDADETRCTLQFGQAARKVQITRRTTELIKLRAQTRERKRMDEEALRELQLQHQRQMEGMAEQAAAVERETAELERAAAEASRKVAAEQGRARRTEAELEDLRRIAAERERAAREAAGSAEAARSEQSRLRADAAEAARAAELAAAAAEAERGRLGALAEEAAAGQRRAAAAEAAAREAGERAERLQRARAALAAAEASVGELGGAAAAEQERRATEEQAAAAARQRAAERLRRRDACRAEQEDALTAARRLEQELKNEKEELRAVNATMAQLRKDIAAAAAEEAEHAQRAAAPPPPERELLELRAERAAADEEAERLQRAATEASAAAEVARERCAALESQLSAAVSEAEEAAAVLRRESDELEARLGERRREARALETALAALRSEAAGERRALESLREQAAQGAARGSALSNAIPRLQSERAELQADCSEAAREAAACGAALSELQAELRRAEECEKQAAAEVDRLRAVAEDRSEELLAEHGRLRGLLGAKGAAQERALREALAERGAAERRREELEERNQRLEDEVAALSAAADASGMQVEEAERARLGAEVREAGLRAAEARDAVSALRAATEGERRLGQQAAREAERLREQVAAAEEELRQAQMDAGGQEGELAGTLRRAEAAAAEAAARRSAELERLHGALQKEGRSCGSTSEQLAAAQGEVSGLLCQASDMESRAAEASRSRERMLHTLDGAVGQRRAAEQKAALAEAELRAESDWRARDAERREALVADVRKIVSDAIAEKEELGVAGEGARRVQEQRGVLSELRSELDGHLADAGRMRKQEEEVVSELRRLRDVLARRGAERKQAERELMELRDAPAASGDGDSQAARRRVAAAEEVLQLAAAREQQLEQEVGLLARRHAASVRQSELQLRRCDTLAADCIAAMDALCDARHALAEEREQRAARESRIGELDAQNRSAAARRKQLQQQNKELRAAVSRLRLESRDLLAKAKSARQVRQRAERLAGELGQLRQERDELAEERRQRRGQSRELRGALLRRQREQTHAEAELQRARRSHSADTHRLNSTIGHVREALVQNQRWADAMREDAVVLARRADEYARSSDDEQGRSLVRTVGSSISNRGGTKRRRGSSASFDPPPSPSERGGGGVLRPRHGSLDQREASASPTAYAARREEPLRRSRTPERPDPTSGTDSPDARRGSEGLRGPPRRRFAEPPPAESDGNNVSFPSRRPPSRPATPNSSVLRYLAPQPVTPIAPRERPRSASRGSTAASHPRTAFA